MSSRPSMVYNSVNGRWEVRGSQGKLKFTVPDTNTAIGRMLHIVGSSAAIAVAATYGRVVGTIAGMSQVLIGDVVMPTCRIPIPTYSLVGFSVPSNSLINFYAQDTTGVATGTLPELSWDVLVVSKTA